MKVWAAKSASGCGKEGIAGRLENMDGSRDPEVTKTRDHKSYLTGVRELVGGEYIGVLVSVEF